MTRRDWLGVAATCGFWSRSLAAAVPNLTISDFAVYSCSVGSRPWVLLELHTEQGLTGLGDATAGGAGPAGTTKVGGSLLEHMRGRNPFEIERLRQFALSAVANAEPRDRRMTAASCSGMEQAMWDLQGKAVGLPCSELLGGRIRDRIRNYANINRATRGDDRTPEGFARNAARGVEAGFGSFKLAPFDHLRRGETNPSAHEAGIQRGIGFLEAVRETIGPDRDLLIDGHSRFTLDQAIRVAPRLARFDLYWMEEMCRETEDLARFNESVDVTTAGGESIWSVQQFSRYIHAGAVDTVMPDVKYCGGMYELKKIAAIAEGAGLKVAPHGPASPLGNIAAAHVCATLPNFDILEFAFGEVPWRAETVLPNEEVRNGYLAVPDRPGLGYEMNSRFWRRFDG